MAFHGLATDPVIQILLACERECTVYEYAKVFTKTTCDFRRGLSARFGEQFDHPAELADVGAFVEFFAHAFGGACAEAAG